MSDRDTQFQGFAKLLVEELLRDAPAEPPAGLKGQLVADWEEKIAHRAYDLVEHACAAIDHEQAILGVSLDPDVMLREVPDLSQWPETNTGEVTISDLRPGALFVTRNGVYAVKTEYLYPDGQCECVLMESGEYAHFSQGDKTLVREVQPGTYALYDTAKGPGAQSPNSD